MAADDRHRSDVHLLRHAGDPDGDRVRLRLRPGHRSTAATASSASPACSSSRMPDAAAVPAPARCPSRSASTTRAGSTTPTSTWPTTCTGSPLPGPGRRGRVHAPWWPRSWAAPCTPEQPPWEMHVVEGLAGGRVGLIAKVHHSVIDGVAGAELLAQAARPDRPRAARSTEPCPPWVPAAPALAGPPDDRRAAQLRAQPGAGAARGPRGRPHRRAPGPLRRRRARSDPCRSPSGRPTRSSRRSARAARSSFAELDMAQVRVAQGRASAPPINDVVLAVCSGALRAHLAAHDQDAEQPAGGRGAGLGARRRRRRSPGNQLSAMFVPLSNDRKTPLERLRHGDGGQRHRARDRSAPSGYGPMATPVAEAVPPALAKPMVQLGVRSGVLRKVRAGNLMISNVPGPDFPLYFAGMELRALRTRSGRSIDGVALNITVQSYRDSLFVGHQRLRHGRARPAGPGPRHGGRAGPAVPMAAGAGEPQSGAVPACPGRPRPARHARRPAPDSARRPLSGFGRPGAERRVAPRRPVRQGGPVRAVGPRG